MVSFVCILKYLSTRGVIFGRPKGGFNQAHPSTAVPDWVDETVAGWIEQETALMNSAWGPAENRGSLAFVHIPPWVLNRYIIFRNHTCSYRLYRHAIQALQPGLNSTRDPGLNGRSVSWLTVLVISDRTSSCSRPAGIWLYAGHHGRGEPRE